MSNLQQSHSSEFETQVLADLAVLRTQMKELLGNGQPGKIQRLEDRVLGIESHQNRVMGAAGVLSIIGAVLGKWLLGLWHH